MKTGVFIQPINEPILKRIMEKHGFSKISPAINFVLQEYNKLTNGGEAIKAPTPTTQVKQEQPQKKQIDFSEWFVVEEGNNKNG